jgi:hypothetical protein
MHTFFIAMLVFLAQVAPSSISGIVSSASRNEPLSRAVVELRPANGDPGQVVSASANGSFTFGNVVPGEYKLSVTRPGYVPMEYNRTIKAAPGAQITGIRFALTQTGTLFGRITDHAGQPIANVSVRAMKKSYSGNEKSFQTEQTAITNDLGEYRLFWLPPNSYFLNALPYSADDSMGVLTSGVEPKLDSSFGVGNFSIPGIPSIQVSMAVNSILNKPAGKLGLNEAYVTTYFPGTTDQERATAINVGPGEEIGSVDIIVAPVPTYRIRGIIIDGRTRQPAPGAQLRRARASALDVCSSRGLNSENCSYAVVDYDRGTFDIPQVTPGSYLLYAMEGDLIAEAAIEVRDSNIDNLVLTLQPGITITGRVVPQIEGIEVRFSPGPPVPASSPLAGSSLPDGTFSVRGLTARDYAVNVSGLKGQYVRSITSGDRDVLERGLQVSGQTDPSLTIVLGTDPGTIEGRVLTAQGEPAAGATVVLIPGPARRHRGDLYRSAKTDDAGRYQLTEVAPGDYQLFAWENIDPGMWKDADFMQTFNSHGKSVSVAGGTIQNNIDVTVIR